MSAGKDWMIMTLCFKTQPFLLELVFSLFIHIYAAFQLIATLKSSSDFPEIFQKNQQGGVGTSVLEYGTTALTILLYLSM